MARLPIPGSDDGSWGDILNAYLLQSLTADGSIRTGVVGSSQLADNAVTSAKLAPSAVTSSHLSTGSVTNSAIADGAIAQGKIANLSGDLAGKASTTHTHSIADTTSLQTTLDSKAASVHTHTASQISDASTAGRSLMTAADAAAQRSALGLGSVATLTVGTTTGTVAAGDDSRITGAQSAATLDADVAALVGDGGSSVGSGLAATFAALGTNANVFGSGSEPAGRVPAADGAGGIAWAAPSSGTNTVPTVASRNLFDYTAVTADKYVWYTNGTLQTNTSYNASAFIAATPGTTYVLSSQQQCAFYNSGQTFISGFNATSGTAPANTAYIRISCPDAQLTTMQLEVGTTASAYTSFGAKVSETDGIDLPRARTQIVGYYMNTASANLFDKSAATAGYYASYTTGALVSSGSYSVSPFIAVTPGTTYVKSNTVQFAFYNSGQTFISGVLAASKFVPPANAAYVRVSLLTADINTFEVRQGGAIRGAYTPYGNRVDFAAINSGALRAGLGLDKGGLVTVAKSGGDFTTISDAVAYCGDSSTTPKTILVYPGTYIEVVNAGASHHISIIGVDKRRCILRDNTGLYSNAPLNIGGSFYMANMTVLATTDDDPGHANAWKEYAVHIDTEGAGTVELFNCYLESNTMAAAGIGLWTDLTVKMTQVELVSKTAAGDQWVDYGALYFHSAIGGSATNQHFIGKDLVIRSVNGKAVKIQDSGSGAGMDFGFINCMAYSDTLGLTGLVAVTTPTTGYSGAITKAPWSYGNNIAELNV